MGKDISKLWEDYKLNKSVSDFIMKEQEKKRSLEAFFTSSEFDTMIKTIKENVSRTAKKYEEDKAYGLPCEDFDRVCSAIYYVRSEDAKEIPSKFTEYAIDYQGIRFGLLIGQGAVYWAQKVEDKKE